MFSADTRILIGPGCTLLGPRSTCHESPSTTLLVVVTSFRKEKMLSTILDVLSYGLIAAFYLLAGIGTLTFAMEHEGVRRKKGSDKLWLVIAWPYCVMLLGVVTCLEFYGDMFDLGIDRESFRRANRKIRAYLKPEKC